MTTPNGSPELSTSQASKEATVNEQIRRTERGANFYVVVDNDLTSPPGSCADGATYIVGAAPTGAWAGHEGDIAIAVGANASSGWYFREQEEGLFAWVQDEDALFYLSVASSPPAWSTFSASPGSIDLDDLADVDVPSPSDGDVLTYDTSSPSGWKAQAPTGGAAALDDLTDVDTTGVSDGDVLTYDTNSPTGWKAQAPTGSGTSKPFLTFRPIDNEPPTSNFATLDTRNGHPVLDFDTTTQETAIFSGVMPTGYAGGGITVSVYFVAVPTSGTVGWDVAIERMDASSLDIDSDSFASAQTITAVTVPGTSGQILKASVNISNGANMDSLAAGEAFRLRVRRDVANDTATGDAELLRVTVEEQ